MQESTEMVPTTVHLERSLLPGEVLAANLELKTLSAASEAACDLNKKYGKNLIEVLRQNTTLAPDGGVDIKVRYDPRKWNNPGDFIKEFVPILTMHLFK